MVDLLASHIQLLSRHVASALDLQDESGGVLEVNQAVGAQDILLIKSLTSFGAPTWMTSLLTLIRGELDHGNRVTILDVTPLVPGYGFHFPRSSRVLRKILRLDTTAALQEEFGKNPLFRVIVVDPRWAKSLARRLFQRQIDESRTISRIANLDKTQTLDVHAIRAIESASVTLCFRGLVGSKRQERKCIRRYTDTYYSCLAVASHMFDSSKVSVLYIPNGRQPSQSSFKQWAEANGVSTFYYEAAFESPNDAALLRVPLSKYPVHDRCLHQDEIRRLVELHQAPTNHKEIAERWIQRRVLDGAANPFIRRFVNGQTLEHIHGESDSPSRPIATIFTSSLDEFVGLDRHSWPASRWSTQEEAIKDVSGVLAKLGYKVIIRVHPNLLSKSSKEVRRVSRSYRNLEGTVLGPANTINSYDLGRASDICLTWSSTIGLELSAMGKKVIVLWHSMYDQTADVRCGEDIQELLNDLAEWKVNANAALIYISMQSCLGIPADSRALSERAKKEIDDATKRERNQLIMTYRRLRKAIAVLHSPQEQHWALCVVAGSRRGTRIWNAFYGFNN